MVRIYHQFRLVNFLDDVGEPQQKNSGVSLRFTFPDLIAQIIYNRHMLNRQVSNYKALQEIFCEPNKHGFGLGIGIFMVCILPTVAVIASYLLLELLVWNVHTFGHNEAFANALPRISEIVGVCMFGWALWGGVKFVWEEVIDDWRVDRFWKRDTGMTAEEYRRRSEANEFLTIDGSPSVMAAQKQRILSNGGPKNELEEFLLTATDKERRDRFFPPYPSPQAH